MSVDEEYSAVYSRYCPEHEEEWQWHVRARLVGQVTYRKLAIIRLID